MDLTLVVSPEVSMRLLSAFTRPKFTLQVPLLELTTGFSLVLGDNTGYRVVVRIVVGESGSSHPR